MAGAMDVDDHHLSLVFGRLQLATQMARTLASGKTLTGRLRGGVELVQDLSDDLSFTMSDTAFSVPVVDDTLQLGGYLGGHLHLKASDQLSFTLDGEFGIQQGTTTKTGGTLNAGIKAKF